MAITRDLLTEIRARLQRDTTQNVLKLAMDPCDEPFPAYPNMHEREIRDLAIEEMKRRARLDEDKEFWSDHYRPCKKCEQFTAHYFMPYMPTDYALVCSNCGLLSKVTKE